MHFVTKRLGFSGLVAAAVLTACSNDATGPDPDLFDPDQTEANLAAIDATFETPAFQSLEVMGGQFRLSGGGGAAATASAAIVADAYMAHRGDLGDKATIARDRLVNVLANASASAPLIPTQWRGLTLVYHPGEGEYIVDEERTDAPADGVRFILYAVNPVTHQISEPLTEIGYADVIDIGTETSSGVRLVVSSEGVTYVDYTVTGTGVFNAPTITVDGMVTDGTNTVEFTLVHAAAVTFAGATFVVDYDIEIVNLDVSVDVHLEVSIFGEAEQSAIDITVAHGANVVNLAGSGTDDGGTFEVRVNNALFATITTSSTGVEVVNANGDPLAENEVRALMEIMEFLDEAFDAFEDFFDPVEWLFDF